jgi:hypothetical protein
VDSHSPLSKPCNDCPEHSGSAGSVQASPRPRRASRTCPSGSGVRAASDVGESGEGEGQCSRCQR